MKVKTLIGVLVVAVGTWIVAAPSAFSTPAISKEIKKPCTHCHVKAGFKELNDIGKCYSEKKNLDECK